MFALACTSILLSQGVAKIHCPDGNTVVVESEFFAEGKTWVACEDLSTPGTRGSGLGEGPLKLLLLFFQVLCVFVCVCVFVFVWYYSSSDIS